MAEAASFTTAARQLFLTQSTLTKTIRELEQEIGLTLFERTTRKVALTTQGNAFMPVARRLLNDFELLLSDLREKSAGSSGSVYVASSLAFASCVLPEVLKRLKQDYPCIHVRLLDDTSGGVVRRIESGEVDIGIGSYVGRPATSWTSASCFPPGWGDVSTRLATADGSVERAIAARPAPAAGRGRHQHHGHTGTQPGSGSR